MSEESRQIHPQEPAEGSEADVEVPGAARARDDLGEPGDHTEKRSSVHPQEPAEGGKDEVDAPGTDEASN